MGLDLDKLKAIREKKKLSQQQAAEAAGMKTRQQWNAVESGRNSPTVETLDRIATALGVSAKDLLK